MLWNTSILPAGSPFVALRKDFERQLGVEQSPTLAAMTVTEHSDRWTVSIDLPGLQVEDINITFNEGSLIIEGERQAPSADGAKELYSDRSFSKFRRVLKVREAIDQNAVDYCVMQSLSIALKLTCKMSPEIPLPGARLWVGFFVTVSSAGKPSGGGIRGATTFDVCHLCRLSKIRLLSSVVVIPVKFFGRIA